MGGCERAVADEVVHSITSATLNRDRVIQYACMCQGGIKGCSTLNSSISELKVRRCGTWTDRLGPELGANDDASSAREALIIAHSDLVLTSAVSDSRACVRWDWASLLAPIESG